MQCCNVLDQGKRTPSSFSFSIPSPSLKSCGSLPFINSYEPNLKNLRRKCASSNRMQQSLKISKYSDQGWLGMSISDLIIHNSTELKQGTVAVRRSVPNVVLFRCDKCNKKFIGLAEFLQHRAELCTFIHIIFYFENYLEE